MKRPKPLLLLLAAGIALATATALWLRPVERIPGRAMPDREVLCENRKGRCTRTVLVRLDAAPFPYEPAVDEDFWAGRDSSGEPYRRFRGRRFRRTPHYVDDRVLIHVTPHRPDGGGRIIVLYLHGHGASLRRDVIGRRRLIDQVNASGRNVILIAPQMAWRAVDSHPGKLGTDGGGARLIKAALEAVHDGAAGAGPSGPASTGASAAAVSAPVVVVAYSGGWRAAMWVALRGGLGNRLRGVVLLDAFFGPVERWADWKATAGATSFLVGIAGSRGRAAARRLESLFLKNGSVLAKRLPARLGSRIVLIDTATPHDRIAVAGPPELPVAVIIARLEAPGRQIPDPAQLR